MHYIIAEKGTTAKRIAMILSEGTAAKRKLGHLDAYEFDGTVVMGLSGHVFQLDFPNTYNNWRKVNPYRLIDAEIVAIAIKNSIIQALERTAKDADHVTIATDYDREGELIGVEALRAIKERNPHVQVDRMRYSALTEPVIKESFAARSEVDFDLAASAEARGIIDLIWGAALTRFISLAANRLGEEFLSVGRVQSPTLALVVDKEREIKSFVPRTYWEVHARVKTEAGEVFEVTHATAKFWDKDEADAILARIEATTQGLVSSVTTRTRTERPPTPFDTTSFIRAASALGITPGRTMHIAESLYLQGLISYHRTDNTTYPETLDLKALVQLFRDHAEFGDYARQLLQQTRLKPTAGKKRTTDHPPIHPTSMTSREQLKKPEWKVYELVVRRFLATLSDAASWRDTEVKLEFAGEPLCAKGRELTHEGFLAIYPYQRKEVVLIPQVMEGESVYLEEISLLEKETKPPKRISQAGLIKQMEELGLGTKSTRHEIVGKLYERGYLEENPAKPTEKAMALVDALEKFAELIAKPEMTKTLEQEMEEIKCGKRTKQAVVNDSRDMLRAVFQELTTNKAEIAHSLKAASKGGTVLGTCPDCGAELFIATSPRGKRFVGCKNYPNCTFSLPLPRSGRVTVKKETCEHHPFLHKLKIMKRGMKRPWDFGCPYCNYLVWAKSTQESAEGS
ncbi:MAG TPA: DNA topoisomerase I [Methanomicrobia archaeon]|nr:DNA topoisomerase I [Methanomicrobia archaeon]